MLWDVQTGGVKRTIAEGRFKERSWTQAGVAFSADGNTVAAATDGPFEGGPWAGRLVLWDAGSGKVKHKLRHALLVQCVAFSPDDKAVASGTGGNIDRDFETVKLWDARTGKLLRTLETTNKMAVRVAFSPDSKVLAAVLQQGSDLAEVILWEAVEGKPSRALPDSDGIRAVAFSPDGKTLLGADRNKLRVWDVKTGETIRASELKTEFSDKTWSALAFSPDGKTLAMAGNQDGKHVIALWEVKTAKRTGTLGGHEGFVWSLAFSPDGRTLASGGADGTIYLWDLDRGTKLGK
jgi:WD40 repeat protein